jgi:hypothetical protein
VIWKLIRGLYFLQHGSVLPEDTTYAVEVREPENADISVLDDLWDAVRAQASQGAYQAVFAHKYLRAAEDDEVLHVWAMLWWDRIIVYCAHLDPVLTPDPSQRECEEPRAAT